MVVPNNKDLSKPIFPKISDAISYLVNLRVKSIEQSLINRGIFGQWQPFPTNKLKTIIRKDWKALLKCSLLGIDRRGPEFIQNLLYKLLLKASKRFKKVTHDKEYPHIFPNELSNSQLIEFSQVYSRGGRLIQLLMLIIPQNSSYLTILRIQLRYLTERLMACEDEIHKRKMQKPRSYLCAAFFAWGGKDVETFLMKVIENTTRGLYLPGDRKAAYRKVNSGTDTEAELKKILYEQIGKKYEKAVRRGKVYDALLGEFPDVMFFPNTVRSRLISKIESQNANKNLMTIRDWRRYRELIKQKEVVEAEGARVPAELIEKLNRLEEIRLVRDIKEPEEISTQYANAQGNEISTEFDYSLSHQARNRAIATLETERDKLKPNAVAKRKIYDLLLYDFKDTDINAIDLNPTRMASRASVTRKTVKSVYKDISEADPNLSSFFSSFYHPND